MSQLFSGKDKPGLLRSYDQEISGFIDRNPGRDVKVRPRGARRNPEIPAKIRTSESKDVSLRHKTENSYVAYTRLRVRDLSRTVRYIQKSIPEEQCRSSGPIAQYNILDADILTVPDRLYRRDRLV